MKNVGLALLCLTLGPIGLLGYGIGANKNITEFTNAQMAIVIICLSAFAVGCFKIAGQLA